MQNETLQTEQNIVKEKHLAVLDTLTGLTVSQAKTVLTCVLEDFDDKAVITRLKPTAPFAPIERLDS